MIARNDAKARLLEAELLRAAERLRVWRHAGCASLPQLLERELGLGPKLARERIRVAKALGELPEIAAALSNGELTYSAVRELTRVATPATEREWLDDVRGKVLRDVERSVSARARGARPSDPPDPALKPCMLRFEVMPATKGRVREAQRLLERERGGRLDDDQLLDAFATIVLDHIAAGRTAALLEQAAELSAAAGDRGTASQDRHPRERTGSCAAVDQRCMAEPTTVARGGDETGASAAVDQRCMAEPTTVARGGGGTDSRAAVDQRRMGEPTTATRGGEGTNSCAAADQRCMTEPTTATTVGDVEPMTTTTGGDIAEASLDSPGARPVAPTSSPIRGHQAERTRERASDRGLARARYQIAITQCATCKQAWQVTGGIEAPISEAMLERATCDAVHIGSLLAQKPARAVQDVPPAVRRLVEQRDGYRCCVPGCRSTSYLELHHIEFRANGGSHEPGNLTSSCGGHHSALHAGNLTITGTAPDRLVFTWHDAASNFFDERLDITGLELDTELAEIVPHAEHRESEHATSMPGVFRDGAASLRAETEHASSMLHAELRDGAASLHAEPEHASSMLHVGLRAAASLETEHASSRLHAARGDAAGHGSVDEPSPIARYRDATNADSSLAGSAPHVGRHDATNLVGDAELVLVTLGFKKLEAKRAVEAAMDLGRAPPTLDRLV